jgi:UMF1 family MFS transporter
MRYTREKWGWVFYDWANSAFATTVMAGFFPVYFKAYWNAGLDPVDSTFRLGLANSVASLLIVLLAPVLGAMADCMSRRKAMLFVFACIGWIMTGGLYLVAEGDWVLAVLLYILAVIGFSGSNIFYDSLLPFISSNDELDRTSAFGFAFGYLGGGLLFTCNILMVLHPEWFGLADGDAAVRISFLMVAAWWLVFSLPLLLLVKEPDGTINESALNVVRQGFKRVWKTLHAVRQLRNVWLFLVAYWLYIDGVDTVVRMAVDYGLSLGFDHKSLLIALLITQFTGFPAAIAFGFLGSRFGPRMGILLGLSLYMVVTVRASLMTSQSEFFLLAFAIGLAQGGIQALSRSLYARMIPGDRTAEFFGFYNMLGKFAAVIGPVMIGWVGALTNSPRAGILSLLVLFVAGALILLKVQVANKAVEQPTPHDDS